MAKLGPKEGALAQKLGVDETFFAACIEEKQVMVEYTHDEPTLSLASLRQLRRLERLCETLQIEPQVGILLLQRLNRIATLQQEVAGLRRQLEGLHAF